MNFLVIGDVVGRSGRTALKENLKKIQDQFNISFTIINAENSAGGYGLTGKIYEELISWGADAITLGNHAWKQKEIIEYMDQNPDHNIIRPLNFEVGSPGRGFKIFTHENGKRILVSQVHGQTFIDLPLSNPFNSIDTQLLSIMAISFIMLRQVINFFNMILVQKISGEIHKIVNLNMFSCLMKSSHKFINGFNSGKFINATDIEPAMVAMTMKSYFTFYTNILAMFIYITVLLLTALIPTLLGILFLSNFSKVITSLLSSNSFN